MRKGMIILGCLLAMGDLFAETGLAQKVRLGTAARINPIFYVPLSAAEEKGFWKENGLVVEWFPFQAGPTLHAALAGRSLDAGITSTLTIMQAIGGGVQEVIVLQRELENDLFIWVRGDSPIREASNLAGKKVGITGLGGSLHVTGQMVAKKLSIEKEVKFVGVGELIRAIAALKTGAVDAAVLSGLYLAELKVKGEVREVAAIRDYLPKPWSDSSMFAHRDFVERSPDVVKRLVRAYLQAMDFVVSNPSWAMAKMQSESGYSEEVAKEVYTRINFGKGGKISRQAMENVRNVILEYGLVSKEKLPPAEKMYTTRFTE